MVDTILSDQKSQKELELCFDRLKADEELQEADGVLDMSHQDGLEELERVRVDFEDLGVEFSLVLFDPNVLQCDIQFGSHIRYEENILDILGDALF